MCSVQFAYETAINSLHSIHQRIILIEAVCALSAVRNEKYVMQIHASPRSLYKFSSLSSNFKQILNWFLSSKLLLHASHAALPIEFHKN
jgi:hypothetical protein